MKVFKLFIFGCSGSSSLRMNFSSQLWQTGSSLVAVGSPVVATLLGQLGLCSLQAQQLWFEGLVAPWHMGSSFLD